MKYLFYQHKRNFWFAAFSLLMAAFSISSCKKINDMELNKGETPLALSVNKPSVSLLQKNDASDAVIFSWTSGTNKGTNAAISYTLLVDKQGSNFSNPMLLSLGKATLSKKFTVKELNDSLINHWNLPTDVETTMEAKLVSTVAGNAAPGETSNTVSFKVTLYKAVTTTLYLIGSATPNGWDAGQATAMMAVAGQSGRFTWQGNLSVGEYKFITTLGEFLPSYNKGASNTTLVYRTDNAQPDDKFTITTAGSYIVTVDLLNLTMTIGPGNMPPYTRLWIVGDATPNGWNIDNPNEMRVDSGNRWIFRYNEELKAGEFKIPTSTGNWGTDYYMPTVNDAPVTSTDVQLIRGGNPDNKWRVTNPGPYKIRLDLQNMKINITPFTPYTQIWMVGDATANGWNIDNPVPMTPVAGDPYRFVYEGPMLAGEFKFPLSTGNWGTDYFMPVTDQSGIGSIQMKFVAGGNPDHKWRLTEAGNYRITIDQLRETIKIEKL